MHLQYSSHVISISEGVLGTSIKDNFFLFYQSIMSFISVKYLFNFDLINRGSFSMHNFIDSIK